MKTVTNEFWSLVERYYDPTTDQFLSVDPLVAQTGQPYAFTSDDPLNSTDPLGLSRVCRPHGHCSGTGLTRPGVTLEKFKNPYDAERFVAAETGGVRHPIRVPTSKGGRDIDVLVTEPDGPQAIEVKTGRQSLSQDAKEQIAKDIQLQNKGYETEWDFYPNGKGVTSPSQPLLDALHQANIDVNVWSLGYVAQPFYFSSRY